MLQGRVRGRCRDRRAGGLTDRGWCDHIAGSLGAATVTNAAAASGGVTRIRHRARERWRRRRSSPSPHEGVPPGSRARCRRHASGPDRVGMGKVRRCLDYVDLSPPTRTIAGDAFQGASRLAMWISPTRCWGSGVDDGSTTDPADLRLTTGHGVPHGGARHRARVHAGIRNDGKLASRTGSTPTLTAPIHSIEEVPLTGRAGRSYVRERAMGSTTAPGHRGRHAGSWELLHAALPCVADTCDDRAFVRDVDYWYATHVEPGSVRATGSSGPRVATRSNTNHCHCRHQPTASPVARSVEQVSP
jgi:hypothetical protein